MTRQSREPSPKAIRIWQRRSARIAPSTCGAHPCRERPDLKNQIPTIAGCAHLWGIGCPCPCRLRTEHQLGVHRLRRPLLRDGKLACTPRTESKQYLVGVRCGHWTLHGGHGLLDAADLDFPHGRCATFRTPSGRTPCHECSSSCSQHGDPLSGSPFHDGIALEECLCRCILGRPSFARRIGVVDHGKKGCPLGALLHADPGGLSELHPQALHSNLHDPADSLCSWPHEQTDRGNPPSRSSTA